MVIKGFYYSIDPDAMLFNNLINNALRVKHPELFNYKKSFWHYKLKNSKK